MAMTRRSFLTTALKASAMGSCIPMAPACLARSSHATHPAGSHDKILVLVQLTGGNDGLNTVVPYGDDVYARSRPTLRLPAGELHKINDHLAFHPRMEAFSRLYKDGHLSIVQGVGSPDPSDNHEKAMRVWHRADLDDRATGWLGRTADHLASDNRAGVPVAFVSSIKRPFVLTAEQDIIPRMDTIDKVTLSRPIGSAKTASSQGNSLLSFLQASTAQSQIMSQRIKEAAQAQASSANYPTFKLAQNLHTIAKLIRADVGTRIFFTELGGDGFGGFDNHANQIGNHCALLQQLSDSMAAFVQDLKAQNLLDRVLLMTYSEFGRTVNENGRRGTGHGAAAPMFLAGGQLKGGLIGEHPSLTDLHKNSLKHHTDFRQMYATALDTWLGLDRKAILGQKFDTVYCLKV
jgi:uncharacterized protein (DUF1501 family)